MPPSNSSAAPPQSADAPLPDGLDATFLACINETIGVTLPLTDIQVQGTVEQQDPTYVHPLFIYLMVNVGIFIFFVVILVVMYITAP